MTRKFEARKIIESDSTSSIPMIKEALKNAGFKKVGIDEDEDRYYAKTKFSISSFSEYIEVTFISIQGETEIKFKSICALPTQIIDWGKNKRNYKRFEKELKKLMPKPISNSTLRDASTHS